MPQRILDDDVVKLYDAGDGKTLIATLFWGDTLNQIGSKGGLPTFELHTRRPDPKTGKRVLTRVEVRPKRAVRFRHDQLLKVRFVDVGQGDGAVVDTPGGQRVLIDGGEGPHVTNYLSVAYAYVLRRAAIHCDAIVVTHGDADHYAGLTKLVHATRHNKGRVITADRVFHNGLVKGTAAGTTTFGKTVKKGANTYITDLADDLLRVPASRMNPPFKAWQAAIKLLKAGNRKLRVQRLEYGDDAAFAFLKGVTVQVLGPITETVNRKPALQFLRSPGGSSLSASHTINGHSIVLKLTYGNVRLLFGADLNQESEERLLERARQDNASLAAEVLKVPHHGSADFAPQVLEAIRPVVSVISSGDESTSKEYIHPRAGLVGALGKYSRPSVEKPLIYVTEMVAFFQRVQKATAHLKKKDKYGRTDVPLTNAYNKISFGIVHVRTDGKRVLVVTHSGKDNQKESYAFTVDAHGEITFENPRIL